MHLNIKLKTMKRTFDYEDVFRGGGTEKEVYFLAIKSVKR